MFRCKPERSTAQTAAILAIGFGASAAAFAAGTAIKNYGAYLRAFGFLALCVTIMLMIRYVLSEYEYAVDNESFSVTRVTGNRRTVVCCVSLSTAVDVLTKAEYSALPKQEKAIIKYSLNQNLKAESYVFRCEFNGRRCMIEFEPNEPFVAILRGKIEEARRNEDGENDND